MQAPLDFGPSRRLWSRLPFLGGGGRATVPYAVHLQGRTTHIRLVCPLPFGSVALALGDACNLSASPDTTTEIVQGGAD